MKKIALVGRTNVGKSTLLNNITKRNISAVTRKVNTTRRVIAEKIEINNDEWILFDTPGLLNKKNIMEKIIWANLKKTIDFVQLIWWVVDIEDFIGPEVKILKELLTESKLKIILVLNKIDRIKEIEIFKKLEEWNSFFSFAALVPISAKNKTNFKNLIRATEEECKNLKNEKVNLQKLQIFEEILVQEIIREQILNFTTNEVPYETGLVWIKFKKTKERKLVFLDLYVNRASQKQIIIGKNGDKIREICKNAESKLSKILKEKIVISLEVKVEKNWYKKKEIVRKLRLEIESF